MKASWYAEALTYALKDKNDEEAKAVWLRFLKIIRDRGHVKLLKFIPTELEKIEAREHAHHDVTLITADEKSRTKWAHAYDHYEKEGIIPANAKRLNIVDESIIGGFQILSKNILIDSSYKKSLVDLYRNITKTK